MKPLVPTSVLKPANGNIVHLVLSVWTFLLYMFFIVLMICHKFHQYSSTCKLTYIDRESIGGAKAQNKPMQGMVHLLDTIKIKLNIECTYPHRRRKSQTPSSKCLPEAEKKSLLISISCSSKVSNKVNLPFLLISSG